MPPAILTTSPSRQQLPLPLSSWRTLLIMIIISLLHALPFLPHVSANQTPLRSKFKAAVYEHAVILPKDPKEIVTREEALSLMRRNLEVYAVQAEEAKRQGADILVFPEDGLYGFRFTWRSLTPYLEFIPDPTVVDWAPCDDPGRFPNTEVQQALSCMARNHSLYVVANMGDNQPCHHQVLPNCNHIIDDDSGDDEHVQYNTDVAFDPTGKLVARYHKQHLFFEKQFDTPPTPELSTFDTPFGRWGLFTCFDILFYQPAVTLVKKLGIANIAFPTAWMDALPLLASIQFHSAFARGMGVNFLAANIHLPELRFQGSGVYTPKGMAAFVHNSTHTSQPRLIVTEVDVLDKPEPEALLTGNRKSSESTSEVTDEIDDEEWDSDHAATSNQTTITSEATDDIDNNEESNSTSTQSSEAPLSSSNPDYETAFVSELFHDLFNFVELDQAEDTLHVCHRNVCCHLTYSMSQDPDHPELFAFGAFDGLHTYEGSYYLQICALVRCADDKSRHSCGSPTNQSSTLFHSLTMRGEMQTDYVYPELLLVTENDQLRLAEAKDWSFRQGIIRSEEGFSYPLLASSLFGRWYERDSEVVSTPPADSEDVKDAAAGFVFGERMVMVVECVLVVACVLL